MDKIALFLCCCIIDFIRPSSDFDVVPLILAIIAVGFISYFDSHKLRMLIGILYVMLCFIYPAGCFFLPVVLYDLFIPAYRFLVPFGLAPILAAPAYTLSDRMLVLMLAMISLLIKLRATKLIDSRAQYLELSDTTKEMSMQLRQQNRDLLEKQDDDVRLATLNERNRIAREIHDNVGHQLSRALLQVGALLTVNKDAALDPPLQSIKETLNTAMDNIRSSVHNLYDTSIDLASQIEGLASQFTFCPVVLDLDLESSPETKVKYALIAIVKESLSNIIKHSDATQVRLSLREHPGFYQLIVSDNGHVKHYNPDDGIGLKNISQRVEALKGHSLIRTKNGFELFITIPKEMTS